MSEASQSAKPSFKQPKKGKLSSELGWKIATLWNTVDRRDFEENCTKILLPAGWASKRLGEKQKGKHPS